jgi:O-antigen/teichoic acid export membrane protein
MSGPRGRLARGALSSAGVDSLLALAAVLAAPVMVGGLGAHAYGLYVLVTVLSGQLGFLQLGLAPAVTRRIAECRGAGDAGGTRATEAAAWRLGLLSSALLAPALLLVGPAFLARAGAPPGRVLPAAAAVIAVQPLLGVVQAILLGRERFTALAAFRLFQGLVRTAAGPAAVVAGGDVAVVLWSQAVVDLAAAVAGAWMARGRGAATAVPTAARSVLALGLPFAASGVLAALLVDGEKLAIGWARSLDQLTYYAVPFGAVFRLGVVAAALTTVLAPRLSVLAAGGRLDEAAGLVRRTTRVTAGLLAAAAAPLIASAPEWLTLWMGASFAARAELGARLLLVAMLANAVASPACTVVRSRGRPTALVWTYAAELPLYVAAVYLLVRGYGIVGAAAAWLLRATLDAVVQRWLAARVLGRPLGDAAALSGAVAMAVALVAACELAGPGPAARLLGGLALSALALGAALRREDWTALRAALGAPPRDAVPA